MNPAPDAPPARPMMSERGFVSHASLWEFAHALGDNRRALLLGYLLLLALVLSAWIVSPYLIAAPLMPVRDELRDRLIEPDGMLQRAATALGFLGLQALFLWGGGRMRIGQRPVPLRRRIVALFLFATLMMLALGGLMLAVWEMPGRNDNVVGSAGNGPGWFLTLLGISWTGWLALGWLAGRAVDQATGLGRLAAMLVGGSWIQFAVALPVDLAARQRHEDCPCESGSFIGLALAGPLLLWAIGPGLYLLYQRERHLTELDPHHARRILQRRSRRVRPPA